MNTRNFTRTAGAGLLGFLAVILFIVVAVGLSVGLVMVVWGAVGSEFDVQGKWRTISFGQALLVAVVMSLVGSVFGRS